jgi:hypothetical protein
MLFVDRDWYFAVANANWKHCDARLCINTRVSLSRCVYVCEFRRHVIARRIIDWRHTSSQSNEVSGPRRQYSNGIRWLHGDTTADTSSGHEFLT